MPGGADSCGGVHAVYARAEPEHSHRIRRLNIPPSARSQIGGIRQGNDVSARPSVSAAPRPARRGLPAVPAHADPARLGTGSEPSRAPCAPLPPPRRAPAAPGRGRNSGKGLSPPWEAPGTSHGLSDSPHLPAARSHPRARSGAGNSAGTAAQPAQVRRPGERVRRLRARHGGVRAERSGSRARAAPRRGGGCW